MAGRWWGPGRKVCAGAAVLLGCGGAGPLPPVPSGPLALALSPPANARAAPRDTDLRITFDEPLAAGAPPADVRVSGRWSGPVPTIVSLAGDPRTLDIGLERPLFAGERVFVTLVAGSYRSASGVPGAGHAWDFRAASAAGLLDLRHAGAVPVRAPGEGHLQTYGAYAGDLDGDGDSDLAVPNERAADIRVFLNDGAGGYGAFAIVPVPQGDDPSTNEGADLDGDGDIDFVVGNARGTTAAVFLGDGAGGLAHHQDLAVGQAVRGICLLDFENDGDPDLVATAFGANRVALFRNDGTGTFGPPATMDVGDGEWSCAPGDADGDGRTDIFIGTRGSNEVVVLGSRGDGTFAVLDRVSAGADPWMLASGDIDGDGHIDLAGVGAASASLVVLAGDGAGSLRRAEEHVLDGFPLAVDLGDPDGDGDLDAVASDFSAARFVLFENAGGALSRHALHLPAPSSGSCAVFHDRDGDGDVDLTGIDETDDVLILFENP